VLVAGVLVAGVLVAGVLVAGVLVAGVLVAGVLVAGVLVPGVLVAGAGRSERSGRTGCSPEGVHRLMLLAYAGEEAGLPGRASTRPPVVRRVDTASPGPVSLRFTTMVAEGPPARDREDDAA
jgi:hypothetical protein